MDWLITIIAGGIIGWLASIIMHSSGGILVDIIVGIIGAFLGRLIFFNLLGIGSAISSGSFSIVGILWGVVGTIVLIAILRGFKVYS